MSKRILVVSQHYFPENFRINDIVDGFLADGIEVDVLCGLPNYPKGDWFDGYRYTGPRRQNIGGAEVFRAGEIPRKGNRGPMIFLNYVSWPVFALFSLPRLRGRRYDAVFCYNTSPVLMALPALRYAKKHRVPLTTYVLDLWPENLYSVLPVKSRFWRGVAQKVSNFFYKKADRLIAMSDSLRARLIAVSGKPAEQVAVIPQYCEDFYAVPQWDAALAEKYRAEFLLVFTGNFSPAQSLPTVLRAVKAARDAGCGGLHLLMVGDGMSRGELEALTDELGARDCITFTGSVPPGEIPKYTALADALVVSLNDSPDLGLTVPAKVASYMAAGKPVLASLNGEGAAAVKAAGCGLASPACDVLALAQNIAALAALPAEERAEMGQKAFAWYQAHYRRAEGLAALEAFLLEGEIR